jgi:hypothetical protein
LSRFSKSEESTGSQHRATKSALEEVQFARIRKDFLHDTELKNIFCGSAFHQINAMTLTNIRQRLPYSKIYREMNDLANQTRHDGCTH